MRPSNRVGATRQYEVFSCAGDHHYSTTTTMKQAVRRAEVVCQDNPGTVVSVWSPLRAHVYQAVVDEGQYKILHGDVRANGAHHYFGTSEQLGDGNAIISEADSRWTI